VEFAPPTGWLFTAQHQGSDPLRDSDANATTWRTGTIGYSVGSAARFVDAGLLEMPIFTDGFESGDTSAWVWSSRKKLFASRPVPTARQVGREIGPRKSRFK